MLVQIFSSTKKDGYGDDIDLWQRYAKEVSVSQITSTNPFALSAIRNEVVQDGYGDYYVMIVQSAHGERAISKVYKK